MELKNSLFYFNYEIFEEHNLLLETFTGRITLELMKKAKSDESLDPRFSPKLNVIADVRSLMFDGTTQQVSEYINFAFEQGGIMGKRKTAVIFATPNQHVYSEIFSKLNNQNLLAVHHFQEVKSALKWINCDKHHTEIEAKLKEIKLNSFQVG